MHLLSELISDGVWNPTLVTSLFSPGDTDLILALPLSTRNTNDKVVWHYEAKGIEGLHAPTSSLSQDASVWKGIWAAIWVW